MSWSPRSRFSASPPAPPAGDLVAKFHIDLVDDSGPERARLELTGGRDTSVGRHLLAQGPDTLPERSTLQPRLLGVTIPRLRRLQSQSEQGPAIASVWSELEPLSFARLPKQDARLGTRCAPSNPPEPNGFIILMHAGSRKVRAAMDRRAGVWPGVDGPSARSDRTHCSDGSPSGYGPAWRAGGPV